MALNDVPLASQTLGITQPLMRTNFSNIGSAFTVDHVDYAISGAGQHKYVTFPVQSAMPVVIAAGTNVLANIAFAGTAKNEIFVHKQNSVTTADIPMTASILGTTVVTNTITNNVWGYLPSGLIVASGFATGTGSTPVNINIGFAFSNILSVTLTPYTNLPGAANYTVSLVGVTGASSFTAFVSTKTGTVAATGQFTWMAILS